MTRNPNAIDFTDLPLTHDLRFECALPVPRNLDRHHDRGEVDDHRDEPPVTEDVADLLRSALPGNGREDLGRALRAASTELAARVVDTGGDAHGSTGYRRRLFAVLAARELG